MTKRQFLSTLKNKLHILNDKEIEDILKEYEDHIDLKVKDGLTEEEAILDFGDIDQLAKEILSAYKISDRYTGETSKIEYYINLIVDKIISFFHDFSKLLATQKGENIIRIVFKVLLILIFIWLLKLPFLLIEGIGRVILQTLPFYNPFVKVWELLIDFAYVVVSVILLYLLIKRVIQEEQVKSNSVQDSIKKEKIEGKTKAKSSKKSTQEKNDEKLNYAAMMFQPFLFLVKILVVLVTLPLWGFVIALAVLLGIMISLLFQGIYLFSAFLIVIGLLTIGCSLLGFIYHVTFKKGGIK